MAGHEHVEGVRVGEDLQTGLLELDAHHDGEEATDQPREQREEQVHRADVLVVGGIQIAPPAVRNVMRVVVGVRVSLCHSCLLLSKRLVAAL